jgi:hypothetical protein
VRAWAQGRASGRLGGAGLVAAMRGALGGSGGERAERTEEGWRLGRGLQGAAAPEVEGKGRRPAGEELAAGSRNLIFL